MTVLEKYNILLRDINSMDNEQNYYASFALFGDSIPAEIWEDARRMKE